MITPPVGFSPRVDGNGWWLSGADGGVFAFGGARYYGSLPELGVRVHDIIGIAATPDGGGYWPAASDGGVFALGDAHFAGSLGGHAITPIVGLARTALGYRIVDASGAATVYPAP